jgi:[ribosomal protein S18]-alanine N-acetyltransferase
MIPEDKFIIRQTKDPEIVSDCAHMMSHSDPWITLGMPFEYCLKAFEGDYRELFVVEFENELAGFVIMQTQGTFKGYIQTICISEAWRGMGVGTWLLKFSENRILSYSPNVFICVSSFNKGAIHLYEQLGFKRVGELENFVKEGFTELLYRKTMGPIAG